MGDLELDILSKSKNEYNEHNFRELSEMKQKILITILSNFIKTNGIIRYEEAYVALYTALNSNKIKATQSLIKSIESNMSSINNYNLNDLFNIIVNNKHNISDIKQLEKLDEYKKEKSKLYEDTIDAVGNGIRFADGNLKKINIILEHYFNISRNQAEKLLKLFGSNKKIVEKYKYFFDDILMILNYSELPNSLDEIEQTLRSSKEFMKICNYYSLFIKFKQEFGKEIEDNLFTIKNAVKLNQFQKAEYQKILNNKGINVSDIMDDIYQIPIFASGNLQPFTMVLKGIRYNNDEYGDYSSQTTNKKYNSASMISNDMIGLFANSLFYFAYNVNANDIYKASTVDGGSDDDGFYPDFTPQCKEIYSSIKDFLFETARYNCYKDLDGNDNCTYSYNEIIINNMIPSCIVYIKKDDGFMGFEEVINAKKRFLKKGIKLPILILDMQECLKTQINNIANKCNEYLVQSGRIESIDDILEENEEIMRLYIQSLATITFAGIDNRDFDLKSKIEKTVMSKRQK